MTPANAHTDPAPAPAAKDPRRGKYLIFRLAHEDFGIPVTGVQEIMGILDITPVPQTPVFLKGVINLRGKVIPVVDLRLKFGFAEMQYNECTCIIVLRTHFGAAELLTGIVVDEVAEVINLIEDDIQDTPDFGSAEGNPFVAGVARFDNRVGILLNIDEILRSREVQTITSKAPQAMPHAA